MKPAFDDLLTYY